MTNERDPRLAELLNEQPAPDHGPDFWSGLDAALAVEPTPVADSSAAAAQAPPSPDAGDTATEIELEIDDATVTDIASHPRFRRWSLALVSVAAVAAAAVIGFNIADEEAAPPDISTNTSVPDGTVETDPGVPTSLTFTSTIPLGAGTAVAWTPDDTGVLVVDDAPGAELGAEGTELLTLWVRPIDGGEPYLAFDDGRTIGTAGADFAFGRNGDVGWAEWCDGSVCGLYMGQMHTDGTIAGVLPVTIPEAVAIEATISDLAWSDEGTLYAIIGGEVHRVNTVDMVAEPVGLNATHIEPYPGATFLAATDDGVVVGPESQPRLDVTDVRAMAISPDANLLAVATPFDVSVYDASGSTREAKSTQQVTNLLWAPDSTTLLSYGESTSTFTFHGSRRLIDGIGLDGLTAAAFAPSGTALAYTTLVGGRPETTVGVFGEVATDPTPAPTVTIRPIHDGMAMGVVNNDSVLILTDSEDATGRYCESDTPSQDLYWVGLDGSSETLLRSDVTEPSWFGQAGNGTFGVLTGCTSFTEFSVMGPTGVATNTTEYTRSAGDFPADGAAAVGFTNVRNFDDNTFYVTGFVDDGTGRVWRVDTTTGGDPEVLAYDDVVDFDLGPSGDVVLERDAFTIGGRRTEFDGEAVPGISASGMATYNRDGQLWRVGFDDEPLADFEASQLFVNRDASIVLAIEKETIGLKLYDHGSQTWTVVDPDGEHGFFTANGFTYTARVENGRGGDKDGVEVRLLDFSGGVESTGPSQGPEAEPVPTSDPVPAPTTSPDPAVTRTCVPRSPAPPAGEAAGMPDAVRQTRDAIVAAAAACDYDTLAQLTGPDFFMGFGVADGVDPMTEWMENEERGRALATLYVDIVTYDAAVRDRSDGSQVWEWPGVAAYDAIDEIPPALLDSYLAQSGLTMAQFQEEWDLFGTYPSFVIGIEPDGTWVGAWPAD